MHINHLSPSKLISLLSVVCVFIPIFKQAQKSSVLSAQVQFFSFFFAFCFVCVCACTQPIAKHNIVLFKPAPRWWQIVFIFKMTIVKKLPCKGGWMPFVRLVAAGASRLSSTSHIFIETSFLEQKGRVQRVVHLIHQRYASCNYLLIVAVFMYRGKGTNGITLTSNDESSFMLLFPSFQQHFTLGGGGGGRGRRGREKGWKNKINLLA